MEKGISQKQLEANRQNAKLGGVKTEEGKAISKYNAVRHGLLSQEVILEDENKSRLEELSEGLREYLKPQGELENILSDRITANFWRLRRCMKIEKNIIEYNKDDLRIDLSSSEKQIIRGTIADMINGNSMDRLMRYEGTIERGIFKSLHELQRLQAQKRGEMVNTPIAVDVNVSQKE